MASHTSFPWLGSKPDWLKRQSKSLPLSHEGTSSSEVNFKRLWITITIVYIHPLNGYRELNSYMKTLAWTLMATRLLHSLMSWILYIYVCVCVSRYLLVNLPILVDIYLSISGVIFISTNLSQWLSISQSQSQSKYIWVTVSILFVAERISYFCLARNLIRPLGSTHNFTQSGWLILFNPDHLSKQHKLGNPPNILSFSELLRSGQTYWLFALLNSSSSTTMRKAV